MAVGLGPAAWLRRWAALANTLVAGLELCRAGAVMLEQGAAFGRVLVEPLGSASEDLLAPGAVAA
jgi:chromatin segregation and condensation protein Rec8/ScpA/Scc1 (kleisin family)